MKEPILDRIRKLLKLSENAGSEHEAALAARRARELMAKHEIHEATVRLEEPERPAEPIEKRHVVTDTKRRVFWHQAIARGVAATYGVHNYYWNYKVTLFGRLSAVQAANYTIHYLIREVERIVEQGAPRGDRAFRNAFRLGCANRIAERLKAAANTSAAVEEYASSPDVDNEPPASAGALMVIQRDRIEVEDAYQAFAAKAWGKKAGPGPRISDSGGYAAGRRAGDRVNLTSTARGALPKGQGSLE